MLIALGQKLQLGGKIKGDCRIASRVRLTDGKRETLLAVVSDETINFVIPDSIFISSSKEMNKKGFDELFTKLSQAFNSQDYTLTQLSALKRIIIDIKDPSILRLVGALENFESLNIGNLAIHFNLEKYRAPFQFGKIQKLQRGTIADLDSLRDIVPFHIAAGRKFTTIKSSIPKEFMGVPAGE